MYVTEHEFLYVIFSNLRLCNIRKNDRFLYACAQVRIPHTTNYISPVTTQKTSILAKQIKFQSNKLSALLIEELKGCSHKVLGQFLGLNYEQRFWVYNSKLWDKFK